MDYREILLSAATENCVPSDRPASIFLPVAVRQVKWKQLATATPHSVHAELLEDTVVDGALGRERHFNLKSALEPFRGSPIGEEVERNGVESGPRESPEVGSPWASRSTWNGRSAGTSCTSFHKSFRFRNA
jgi:hypothetical protein